ncbi:MAG: hypothetical protein L6365_17820 [Desulfobulbaceae bacterium]|nr:hypothetical protein [Desulfobulbaceae bacterium]
MIAKRGQGIFLQADDCRFIINEQNASLPLCRISSTASAITTCFASVTGK